MKIIGTEKEVELIMVAIKSGISCGLCFYKDECESDKEHGTCQSFIESKIDIEIVEQNK